MVLRLLVYYIKSDIINCVGLGIVNARYHIFRRLAGCYFKPMKTVGSGVVEIRLKDAAGIYRMIYTAKIGDTIYVLHAFQKKTQKTSQHDIELAKTRYKKLLQEL